MDGVFVELAPRRLAPVLARAMRRCLAQEATALRDAVRAADLPLPVAAVAASLCTLVVVAAGRGAP